jgi:hypothetical protein
LLSAQKSTLCPAGSLSDGHGGCYIADTCEMLYGSCNCESGITKCCAPDECTAITTTIIMTTISDYPWWTTTQKLTTRRTTTPCPPGTHSDGHGGCYIADTCEMLYGPCNCKSGRTKCCTQGQCIITTVPPTSTNKNKCHKK